MDSSPFLHFQMIVNHAVSIPCLINNWNCGGRVSWSGETTNTGGRAGGDGAAASHCCWAILCI